MAARTGAQDDLLGSNTWAFSADGLVGALPSRGTSFTHTHTRTYSNCDANYSLTMTISRVV